MSYEIEKSVPIPASRKTGGLTDTLRKLKQGDSFLIPAEDLKDSTQKSLFVIAKRLGYNILTRKNDDGLRVWGLESPKINLTPEIYQRFAEYYRRNVVWGIFHVALDDGNYDKDIKESSFNIITTAEEKELATIFNQLSHSQRKKLGRKAEEIVERVKQTTGSDAKMSKNE